MENFIIKNISSETLSIYKNCFDQNDSPKEVEVINWQFLETPVNKKFVSIYIDKDDDKVAAIYAVFPVNFKILDAIQVATQSLDTITDINYRGKGLFIKLAKDVYQKAKDDGVAFVYGFPNGNSIHGFKTKLEWEVLDPVPFLIKPLETSYFTNKISWLKWLPNVNLFISRNRISSEFIIEESNSFPETVNNLWDNFSKNISVALNRNKEYLDWRYVSKPNEAYKIAHCYDQNKNHLGYIIYTTKEKHGGKIAYIMELIYNLEFPKAAENLLKFAVNQIKKEQADCILSWSFDHSPNYKALKKAFFIKLPNKLRPIELHFGVRTFNKNIADVARDRKNWYLSYSDSDTV